VSTNNFKENNRKAREIVLDNCLDLGQLPNPEIGPDFFVKEVVKIGVAYKFVSDTKKWLKQCKRRRPADEVEDYGTISEIRTVMHIYLLKSRGKSKKITAFADYICTRRDFNLVG